MRKNDPTHHSQVAPEATEDHDDVAVGREHGIEVGRRQDRDVDRKHVAGDRCQRRRQGERLELVGERVLPERAGGVLVLADGVQHTPPRRANEECDERGEDEQQNEVDEQEGEQEVRRDTEVLEPAVDAGREARPGV